MTSKAFGLAQLGNAYADGALSNRNRVINGAFQVAQRGTSGTTTSSGYVSLDRWRAYISGSSTVTLSQQVFTPGQTDVAGDPEFFMRYDWLGTNPALTKIIMQRIENVKSLVGTVTLSFWARTELGDDVDVEVYQNFGSGGSTEVTAVDQTINCTSSWQKFTLTFDLPSLSGKTIGSSSYIEVSWRSAEGTNSYLDLALVQLEAGDTATPFEHRSFGQELALCQRYYQTSYVYGTAVDAATGPTEGASFISINTSDTSNGGLLPVTMRATPTFAMYSTIGGSGSPSARDDVNSVTVTGITLIGGTTTSLPRLNKAGGLSPTGSSYSAHYTASAEL